MRGVARVEHVLQGLRPLTKDKPHPAVRRDLAELVMDALRTSAGRSRAGSR